MILPPRTAFLALAFSVFAADVYAQTPEEIKQQLVGYKAEVERLESLLKKQQSQLRQLTLTNKGLKTNIDGLNLDLADKNSSIGNLNQDIDGLKRNVKDLDLKNQQLTHNLAESNTKLQDAYTLIEQLRYEKNILSDNKIIRIYPLSPKDSYQQFLARINRAESGFKFDDNAEEGELKITKEFDAQAEAWWIFDKTLDTILEVVLQFQPHRFDPNKTLLLAEPKLLQKTRFSNKPFEEQQDMDKVKLYRDKVLRMLEGELTKSSEK
ncbi:MAG: hypothetical protein U0X91_24020 [Spirosomataceae bacterium]